MGDALSHSVLPGIALAWLLFGPSPLALFIGAFAVQWGIGYLVDVGIEAGWSRASAFDLALGIYLVVQIIGYIWFLIAPRFFPSTPIS